MQKQRLDRVPQQKRRCFIGKQRREKTQLLTVYHCLCPGPLQQEDSWHILFRQ